ncbi:hypothetical protein ATER59S_00923 [Aquamicrobium terrae]
MILDQFDTGGRSEKIDRAALIKSGRGAFQPLLSLSLRSKDVGRFRKNLGEFPRAAALILAKRF